MKATSHNTVSPTMMGVVGTYVVHANKCNNRCILILTAMLKKIPDTSMKPKCKLLWFYAIEMGETLLHYASLITEPIEMLGPVALKV